MRLRSKLFLITAGVGIIPIVAVAAIGRAVVEQRERAQFERQLEVAEERVHRHLAELRQQLRTAVERLADPEDNFVGRLLIAQARGGDETISRELPMTAPRVMRERGLELLLVVGPSRRIVASGHFPGRIGDRARARDVGRPGQVRMARVRVMERGRPRTRLTLQAWEQARSPLGPRLLVMAGRIVRLESGDLGQTKLQLRDARGRVLLGPRALEGSYPPRVIPLRGEAGRLLATVTLSVPDARLRENLRLINYAALGLIGAAVALGLLLAGLARRTVGPLDELAVAAEAVAGGDLERHLTVRSRDEVGELVAAFNRMTSELRESKERLQAAERIAAWREIARAIAHELKNPLFPIQTAIETLRKVHERKHPSFEEVFDESTSTILEEVERLKRIVGEFSSFARMPKPRLSEFELGEWLRSTVALYQRDDAPVALQVEPDLPLLRGDREQLTQVLVNLLKNAQDATRELTSPRVEVSLRRRGGQLELRVSDNGVGFSAETARELFTPYFTTKGGSGGTGLGLAICQRIATEHGGSIEARGVLGQGAAFVIRLPFAGPVLVQTEQGDQSTR
jgi:two-component system nitrogen regulation sensor histidine kinase NtrY